MPDYTIASQVKVPDALQTFGNVVNIANQATELQKKQATMQADIAKAKAESEVSVGTAQPRISAAQAEAQTKWWELNASQANYGKQLLGGLLTHEGVINDDGEKSTRALMDVEDQMTAAGLPKEKIKSQLAPYYAAAHAPGRLLPLIKQTVAGGIAPSGQGPAVTPGYVEPGATQKTQVNPLTPGAQPPPQTIAPAIGVGQQETTKQDVLGNPYIESKTPQGQIQNKPVPGGTPPLLSLPPGENAETAKQLMALRQQTNQAAAGVPTQHFNNKQVIELAPKAFTGTGAGTWSKVFSAFNITDQLTGDTATNTDRLNHILANQTENNAKSMGANTDAARHLAETAGAGSASSPERALIARAKINDAYATGLDLFNRGMEAAIKHPENKKSVLVIRDFQNQWSQNFDPVAMQLHNAVTAKNSASNAKEQHAAEADINDILKSVGGKGSKGAAALAQKYLTIEKLSTDGRL